VSARLQCSNRTRGELDVNANYLALGVGSQAHDEAQRSYWQPTRGSFILAKMATVGSWVAG